MNIKRDKNLWNADEISDLFSKQIGKDWECNSIEIDSRKVKPGNTFLAMPGTKFDGHDFILEAIKAGARSIIIKNSLKISTNKIEVIQVEDVNKSLLRLAKASRKRINKTKNIIAITGSSGKTSTKEMLGKAFSSLGKTFVNPGSYNNQVGVPFSLANMPRNTDYGIFELGMNHFNEISILSKLVQPNIVIITNISEAHIGNFNSIQDIIKAKTEIFNGLKSNGYILINNDNYYDEIQKYTKNFNRANILTYGLNKNADIRLVKRYQSKNGQKITAEADGKIYNYKISLDGQHQAINSLAVIGSLLISKCDINKGLNNIGRTSIPTGRGTKYNLLIKGEKSKIETKSIVTEEGKTREFEDAYDMTGDISLNTKTPQYSKLRQDLKLTKETMDVVSRAVIKTFGTKLPEITTNSELIVPSRLACFPIVTFSDLMSASTLPLISIVDALDILPLKD